MTSLSCRNLQRVFDRNSEPGHARILALVDDLFKFVTNCEDLSMRRGESASVIIAESSYQTCRINTVSPILSAIIARCAVVCAENAKVDLDPFSGNAVVDFESSGRTTQFVVQFENTGNERWLRLHILERTK